MTDIPPSADQGPQRMPVREFKIGETNNVSAIQKGRVTQLSREGLGTTFLIDVSDRIDPTRGDETRIGDLYKENDADIYHSNNGVVVAVTDKLDPERRKRVYLGLPMIDEDDEGKEITSYVLHEAGLKGQSTYVPMSFDSDLVVENMGKEIQDAVRESGNPNLFSSAQKLLDQY